MALTNALVGLAVLVGLVGIVLPVLPGSGIVLVAVLAWAAVVAEPAGWLVAGVAAALLVVGGVVKYAVPGRRLTRVGVPHRTLVVGGLAGIVGFFVVPVVGLLLGFLVGVYLVELRRVGRAAAWPSTRSALYAAGLSILIELAAGLLAASTWLVGALTVRSG